MSSPISMAPESPMKIFEGNQLCGRKPTQLPTTMAVRRVARSEAVQQDGGPVDPVGREEERRSPDDRHSRGEAVQSVDEVERVHGGHDQPGRQHDAHGLVLDHERLGNERDDRHPDSPGGHDQCRGALADQLDPPAQVQQVVRDADEHDHGGAGEDAPGRRVVAEDVLDEERIAGHDQRHQDPREDAQAAEPGDRRRMHVAAADRGIQLKLVARQAGHPRWPRSSRALPSAS